MKFPNFLPAEDIERLQRDARFACRVCGVQCTLCGQDGAICEEHCPDHNYVYIKAERGHFCETCGKRRPDDWFED